ncbi:hypothetical protein MHB84_24465 [Paenibacillus sp. FSL F4-0087]|uniref:hypothetical protein n=1 Tax=Paenibacillus sp. FSL F4-0087 TaxID=2921368 RepID=UPI00096F42F1|nr:hypothetical protein BK122_11010 [Paenibacillus pabuli]
MNREEAAPELKQFILDREVMVSLWGITHLGRAWAVEPEGMLRSNRLISDAQVALMERWLDLFSYAVMVLIEDGGEEEAFWGYQEYVRERVVEKN